MELTPGQRAVVDHEHGAGPCRVVGGFGSGLSTALRTRADRLQAEGVRVALVSPPAMIGFAVDLLRRHGRPVSLLSKQEQVAMLATLVRDELRPLATEVAAAVEGFQASFLGDEELRVHADAAGALGEAEELISITASYLELLQRRNRVDAGGALVAASLLLRDAAVLDGERALFDELLVDDFQLATFGVHRLVSQLVGPGGAVTVAGNRAAAVATAPLASPLHLERFDRRFGVTLDVSLEGAHRTPVAPVLRIVEDSAAVRRAAQATIEDAATLGLSLEDTAVVSRDLAEAAVGRSWPLVVVPDATAGRWPAPRPVHRWFDTELFHGPDVPDDDAREQRWHDLERRRFAVACSRATRSLVVVAEVPVTPFVGDLVR